MDVSNPAKKLKVDHVEEYSLRCNDTPEQELTSSPIVQNGKPTDVQNGKSDEQNFEKFVDEEYFSSYADTEVHRTMIEDQVRTDAYHKAIMQDPSFVKDKIVCDVGCGSGILSLFCAQAGAKKVYAIEASQIAMLAKKSVIANGFEDIITVLEGRAEDVELPEKVDVIVSEWMGYMMLYETMLPSVLHIRDKWLKPGGVMFPERAVLKVAMGEASWITKYEENTYDFWIALNPMYGLDMTLFADHAVEKYSEYAHVFMMPQKDVLSLPATVCDFDLNTVTAEQLLSVKADIKLSSMGSRRLNCLVFWFDVFFPGGVKLSTSPDLEDTHWQNTVLPLPPTKVVQDTAFSGEVTIAQHKKRSLDIRLRYCVGDSEKMLSKRYRLDENCTEFE
ncbi:protein arginine N-methyltransferase 6 isoform X2 [Hyalella azteca]|uniref:Protein arginine N-methyltransferase 6 n=1 Tax=Hyalella azteca TaxID=294128 RepID=A0A8B7PFF4_HYAAZ|nr:protein arginine N-methyltransferase 6 isoform X1 [Hyalella azteca]XP_018024032.1 protein arginine N-methyltransferase 6 isoform X2 [Hyalella azteca]